MLGCFNPPDGSVDTEALPYQTTDSADEPRQSSIRALYSFCDEPTQPVIRRQKPDTLTFESDLHRLWILGMTPQ
jgi:hypothetical protein